MKILVIGACNIDIIGKTNRKLIQYESNIGEVKIALGGVAKNIATDLHFLNADVHFLTLIGNDHFAQLQEQELNGLGLNYANSFFKPVASSMYLAINGHDGDLDVAVNDMRPFENLTKEDFKPLHQFIEEFDVLVFDTNLSEDTICYLIETYQHKQIFVDGVSQSKVLRIEKVLNHIDLLKINQYELNALLKKANCDIIKGAKELINRGLKTCLISSSNEPITYNIGSDIYQSITHKSRDIKSTLGAGDALFSGVIAYVLKKKNMHEAVNFGKIVASKTLEVSEASNIEIKKLIDL